MFNIEELKQLSKSLNDAQIHHALGGSGLLSALGITVEVNDWDITTDCPLEALTQALAKYDYVVHSANDTYASDYLIKLEPTHFPTDIIGNFTINTKTKPIKIQTIITDYWHGIPLGSPEEWHKAYVAMNRAMNRNDKAALLADYLNLS